MRYMVENDIRIELEDGTSFVVTQEILDDIRDGRKESGWIPERKFRFPPLEEVVNEG